MTGVHPIRARSYLDENEERTEEKNTNGTAPCIDCHTANPYMPIAGRCRTCQTTWLRLRRNDRTRT